MGTDAYPRPCDPNSVRAVRARLHAERKRRVQRGDWSPPREVPDRRPISTEELPALVSRQQLQDEMMAWDKDLRGNRGRATHGRSRRQQSPPGDLALASGGDANPRRKETQARVAARRTRRKPAQLEGDGGSEVLPELEADMEMDRILNALDGSPGRAREAERNFWAPGPRDQGSATNADGRGDGQDDRRKERRREVNRRHWAKRKQAKPGVGRPHRREAQTGEGGGPPPEQAARLRSAGRAPG